MGKVVPFSPVGRPVGPYTPCPAKGTTCLPDGEGTPAGLRPGLGRLPPATIRPPGLAEGAKPKVAGPRRVSLEEEPVGEKVAPLALKEVAKGLVGVVVAIGRPRQVDTVGRSVPPDARVRPVAAALRAVGPVVAGTDLVA